ncbi:NADPH:quinone oxidoreductase family protein [Sphingobium sp. CAP-1]|uniref:NADPH:quinone oxidoreductase family protein n=1 Tax=Sphingobium sp. CAP-1 TaxID=2676077 RepID=UPI0012BB33EE|nr:NADPH:quinone oxidoreductase family protein [Sphingobium sp. CAP-1]QGP80535.1 zinc-binding dehydrogenase [Sphingobium sp. CAP-1]
MKAIICESFAPVQHLKYGVFPAPEPGPGEVLIQVAAAGVNYPDVLIVQGKYQTRPALPFVPGSEAAGRIAALGAGVEGFAIGDRVIAFTGSGAFAEQVRVPATQVWPVPDGVDLEVAAGIAITYGTSYHALKDRAALKPGETLLVLGAGGGVGLTAVELGKHMGARVIAAASSPEKLALAKAQGADELIDYAQEDLRERIRALTDGKGVDIVYDPVGGPMNLTAVKSLAWGGRLLVIGFAGGDIPAIPANLLLLKSASAVGVLWGNSVRADPVTQGRNMRQLLAWLADGVLRPIIDTRFALPDAVAALQHLERRKVKGKVLLTLAAREKE